MKSKPKNQFKYIVSQCYTVVVATLEATLEATVEATATGWK